MAKMHFKYATMNSGKSIDLMRTAYNYEENGYKVLVIKPKIDTKDGDYISSRVGMKRKVDYLVDKDDSVLELLKEKLDDINCILIDEAQFLSSSQVDEFYVISKAMDIPILCYGLRNNFKMEAFEGSKRLLELSEELEEITTLCKCGEIARYVGRMYEGVFQNDGDEVVIDGEKNYDYVPMCGDCYLEKVKKLNLSKIKEKLGK